MRPVLFAVILPSVSALAPIHSFRLSQANSPPSFADNHHLHAQQPIFDVPGPAMPSDTPQNPQQPPTDPPAGGPGTVILSDVMGRDRSINVFAGLVRDVESVARRLDDSAQNSTVLAPLNSAMEKLPRKPWEDEDDYNKLGADAYEGDDGWKRAQRNIRRFVEAHIIPQNPWNEGDKVRAISGDAEVWWEGKDGKKFVSASRGPAIQDSFC